MKILVVEDQLGDLMLRALRRQFPDAETRLALNGVDGVREFRIFNPDLIISDWNMPRMDGGEMAAEIRRAKPDQKIILWSGSFKDVFAGFEQHFNLILTKDVNPEELKDAIEVVLSGRVV